MSERVKARWDERDGVCALFSDINCPVGVIVQDSRGWVWSASNNGTPEKIGGVEKTKDAAKLAVERAVNADTGEGDDA